MENWKNIDEYPNYSVSNLGNIRNDKRGKLLKLSMNTWGYCTVSLYKNGIERRLSVHRLVAMSFIANPLNKKEVNHINGNKRDNSTDNLEWMTRSENMKHATDNGLLDIKKCYSKSPKIKGKKIQVYEKETGEALVFKNGAKAAKHYSVSESYFSKIITFNHGENRKYKAKYI